MTGLGVGDRVRQVHWPQEPLYGKETLGTVISIDSTGKPDIRWDDGTLCSLPGGWLESVPEGDGRAVVIQFPEAKP